MQPDVDEELPFPLERAYSIFADMLPGTEDPQLEAWLEAPPPTSGVVEWER